LFAGISVVGIGFLAYNYYGSSYDQKKNPEPEEKLKIEEQKIEIEEVDICSSEEIEGTISLETKENKKSKKNKKKKLKKKEKMEKEKMEQEKPKEEPKIQEKPSFKTVNKKSITLMIPNHLHKHLKKNQKMLTDSHGCNFKYLKGDYKDLVVISDHTEEKRMKTVKEIENLLMELSWEFIDGKWKETDRIFIEESARISEIPKKYRIFERRFPFLFILIQKSIQR
jgi:hypothetical protein